jgi:hypothetical protein
MRVLALVSAAILSTGCATRSPEVAKQYPPTDLLADCPHPVVNVTKNKGLAEGILAYRQALDKCNNDKAALREWQKE